MSEAEKKTGTGDRRSPSPPLPSIERLIATKDWGQTSLGPADAWPASLRTVLRLMLTSRYSMWLGWGPELLFFCNEAYREQTLGAKYPKAIGRPFRDVWAEAWDVLEPRIRQVVTTGEATWDEGLLLFLERSGYPEETYHSFSYSPAPGDKAGEIGGLFCVVVEETDRIMGERRIALLGRFASLLAQAKTAPEVFGALETCLAAEARDIPFSLTYAFDDDGRTARCVSKTGFDDARDSSALGLEDGATWPLQSVLSSGEPLVVDRDLGRSWPVGPWKIPPSRALLLPIRRQGESRPAGVFVAGLNPHRRLDDPLRSFAGLLVGQLGAGLSNAGAYEEQRKRAEALAEIDRAKTTFFSNVSHEFRTPLTLMLAPLDDMRAAPARDPAEREQVELLHRNALRLLKLVNTLLDFSRIEAGRVEAVFEPTDLAALTIDLASSFRAAIERAGLALIVDCPTLEEPIFIDPAMWEKIVLNLLSNAFKFTFEGSITVRLRGLEDAAVLEVSDTGIGIAEEDLPRLFERFHRIEGARSRSHEGSGIGLALVQELARMHRGELAVKSRLGEGTTFSIHIPRGTAHLPKDRLRVERRLPTTATRVGAYVEEALRWGSPTESVPPVPSPRLPDVVDEGEADRERILVADDNADMRTYISRLLSERWRVEAVSDGNEALAAVRRSPPDLILSDVMMPHLDGFGLIRALRDDPTLRTIPVVLLSARAGEEATSEGLNAGADDYVIKPFTARELLVRITARLAAARAARAIEEQQKRLYRVFMGAPFIVSILRGPELVVELANELILRAWGKGNEIIGLPFRRAVPELAGQPFNDLLEGVYATGVTHQGRGERAQLPIGPGGAFVDTYWNYEYVPLFGAGGSVEGVMICGFDVTEQVTARRHAEALAETAERVGRAKDEFLATMSHELRTPLNAMLGWARILKTAPTDPTKLAKGLAVIERNAQSQARLVSDLLDVSRIISGKLLLALQRVELSAVIDAAIDVVKPAADAKGIALVKDVVGDVGAVVADPDRIQQIVWNLLSNAVRCTSAGSVTITARRSESQVRIVVTDTGSGIAAEHLAHIFERFRQVDASTTRSHGGLGLGLAIVRHLAEAHGGTVTGQSEGLGKGAVFTVLLPVRAVVPANAKASATPLADRKSPLPGISLRGVRVLVVDDDEDSLDLVREVLEGAGASFRGARSALEALDAPGPFDVIISDIGMPQMDGYAFMRRLRSQESGGELPAIALTAYARAEDAERAIRAGFQEHLAKPIEGTVLLEAVERWSRSPRRRPERDERP